MCVCVWSIGNDWPTIFTMDKLRQLEERMDEWAAILININQFYWAQHNQETTGKKENVPKEKESGKISKADESQLTIFHAWE